MAAASQKIFVGGVVGFADMENPANLAALIATGLVGLYTQEAAMSVAYSSGGNELQVVAQNMAGTGSGETELNLQPSSAISSWFSEWWNTVWLANGLAPTEINSIINFSSSTWVADFDATVDVGKEYGITSDAPIFSPNDASNSLTPFATNPVYSAIRSAALYGGAIAIDAPPHFFLQNSAAYQQFTYEEIQWGHQNDLRVTVILSPSNDDNTFGQDTEDFVSDLQSNNAVPTEWVVENYDTSDPDGIGSDTDPNSVSGVALWVALNAETNASGASTPVVTPAITISAPGSIAEAIYGAGVTVTETISTVNVFGPIYVAVYETGGVMESSTFIPVAMNSSNQGSVSLNFGHNSDYVVAENRLNTPSRYGYSAPITITEAIPQSIAVSAPGSVAEATYSAGVTATETISATNTPGMMYAAVFTAAGVMESAAYVPVAMTATGQGTVTQGSVALSFAHSGDYVSVKSQIAYPFIWKNSAPITITDQATTGTSATNETYSTVSAPSLTAVTIFRPSSVLSMVSMTDVIKSFRSSSATIATDMFSTRTSAGSDKQVTALSNAVATSAFLDVSKLAQHDMIFVPTSTM